MVVGGVAGLARHLQHAVAAGQRLADIRAMPQMRGIAVQRDRSGHWTAPVGEEKGEAGSAGMRAGVPAAARVSARTMIRRASSILKALSPDGLASPSATSAA